VFPTVQVPTPSLASRRVAHSFDPHLGLRITREVAPAAVCRGPVSTAAQLAECYARLVTLEADLQMHDLLRQTTVSAASKQNACKTSRPNLMLAELSNVIERLGRRVRALGGVAMGRGSAVRRRRAASRAITMAAQPCQSHGLGEVLGRGYAELGSLVRQAFDTVIALEDLRSTEILFDAMQLIDRHRVQLTKLTLN
jgi:hypothetical protein